MQLKARTSKWHEVLRRRARSTRSFSLHDMVAWPRPDHQRVVPYRPTRLLQGQGFLRFARVAPATWRLVLMGTGKCISFRTLKLLLPLLLAQANSQTDGCPCALAASEADQDFSCGVCASLESHLTARTRTSPWSPFMESKPSGSLTPRLNASNRRCDSPKTLCNSIL
jgi:hypothetical protein